MEHKKMKHNKNEMKKNDLNMKSKSNFKMENRRT